MYLSRPVLLFAVLAVFFCPLDADAQAVDEAAANAPAHVISGEILQSMAEMNFDVMTMKQGLPHDSVYWLAQDTTGYIWIATFGGLSRFDGYQFRNYTFDGGTPGTLPDSNVRVLLPRPNGDLYVGTGSSGLVLYSAATDSFTLPEKQPQVLRKSRVFSLTSDGNGGVWFGVQNGMGHFDPVTGDFEMYGRISAHPGEFGFPAADVYSVLQDKKGNLWAGTSTGLYRRSRGEKQFQLIPGLDGAKEIGRQPPIWTIFEDRAGKIWIGTDAHGMGVFDAESQTVHGVLHVAGAESELGTYTIRGMIEVEPDVFWIGTYGGGLYAYNGKTQTLIHWAKDPTASQPLSSDFVRSIFRDRSGVIWAGTDNGLSSISALTHGIFNIRSSPLRPNKLFGSEVRSVNSGYGRVWVGFDQGGFAEIDRDGKIYRINPAPGLRPEQLSHREVLAMAAVDETTVIAGGVGLYSIDVRSHTYRPIDHPDLNKQLFNAVYVDGDEIWAGRYTGLVRYNRRAHEAKVFEHKPGDTKGISDNYVRDMFKDSHGRFWITTRLGIDLYVPATESFQHFRHDANDPASIASDNVQPIAEDGQGRLWVGSIGAGLAVLDEWPVGGKPRFRAIDHAHNGLPDDTVLVIRRGLDGTMWVNTPRGLAAIDPKSFKMQVFGAPEGLQTTAQNLFSSALLNDGTVLFPGNASVVFVRPDRLHPWNYQAPLVLTSVKVQGNATSPVKLAAQAMAGTLQLPSHRGVEIGFSLLDYSSPADTLYSYQLEGFDDAWTEPSSERRSATYTNLPGGDYTFHLRSMSRNGAGPTTEINVPIHVGAAITERWWFQTLITILILAAVIFFIRLRLAFMSRRQHELEAEVAARTAELHLSRQELLQANERLEKLALRDSMTGVLNRRGFFDRAGLELSRAQRSGRAFSLLLLDLDNFKQMNDTMGHGAGDAVLCGVAALLEQSVRTADILARYGGEEFVVMLPETEETAAYLLADRLRAMIQELTVEHAGLAFKTTASFGLAMSNSPQEPLDALLARADHALYQAKHSGKNRVCIAE